MAGELAVPVATASLAMMIVLDSVPIRPWNGQWGEHKYRQVDRLTTRAAVGISLPVVSIKIGR